MRSTISYIYGRQYGKSSRGIRNRIYEHISSVKLKHKNKTTPVSRHYSENGHNDRDMMFTIIEWLGNRNDIDMTRKRRAGVTLNLEHPYCFTHWS